MDEPKINDKILNEENDEVYTIGNIEKKGNEYKIQFSKGRGEGISLSVSDLEKVEIWRIKKSKKLEDLVGGSVAEIARLAVSENPREREIANQENTKHYLLLKSLQ